MQSNLQLKTSEILNEVILGIQTDQVTLRELVRLLGNQGLLVLCALLSLPFLFPVSIPGVSTVFGAGIILIAIAVTTGRVLWLPKFVADRRLETKTLIPVLQRGVGFLKKIDHLIKPRLLLFSSGIANRLNGLALILSGVLLMIPFGLIPFSNTLPGIAILLFSAGMLQRDGLFVLGGHLMNEYKKNKRPFKSRSKHKC